MIKMQSELKNITAMLIFGTIGIFVRNIDLSSKETALMRGIIGSLFLLGVLMCSKKKISFSGIRKNLLILFLSGTGIGLNWIFLFQAYKYTTVSTATLSYYSAPVIVTVLSPVILKERLPFVKFLCVLGAMTGMAFIAGNSGQTAEAVYNHTLGIIYGLSAAVFYASVIIMNKFIKGLGGLETTVTQLILASIVLLPYVMITDGFDFSRMTVNGYICLAVLGAVHTGFAYFLYFSSLKELKGQTIAVLSYIDPISAVMISSVLLGERMTVLQIVGGVLILSSTFISENTNLFRKIIKF